MEVRSLAKRAHNSNAYGILLLNFLFDIEELVDPNSNCFGGNMRGTGPHSKQPLDEYRMKQLKQLVFEYMEGTIAEKELKWISVKKALNKKMADYKKKRSEGRL